jgi:hypothetical protein
MRFQPIPPPSPPAAQAQPASRARTASEAFADAHEAHQPPPALRTRPPTLTGAASLAPQNSLELLQLQAVEPQYLALQATVGAAQPADPADLLDQILAGPSEAVPLDVLWPHQFHDADGSHAAPQLVPHDTPFASAIEQWFVDFYETEIGIGKPVETQNLEPAHDVSAIVVPGQAETGLLTRSNPMPAPDDLAHGSVSEAKVMREALEKLLSKRYMSIYNNFELKINSPIYDDIFDSSMRFGLHELMSRTRFKMLEGDNPPHYISRHLPEKFRIQLEGLLIPDEIYKGLKNRLPNLNSSVFGAFEPVRSFSADDRVTFTVAAVVHAALKNGHRDKEKICAMRISTHHVRPMRKIANLSSSHQLWIYKLCGLDPTPPTTSSEYNEKKSAKRQSIISFISDYEKYFGGEKTQTPEQKQIAIYLLPFGFRKTFPTDRRYISLPDLILHTRSSDNEAHEALWTSLRGVRVSPLAMKHNDFFNEMRTAASFQTIFEIAEELKQP